METKFSKTAIISPSGNFYGSEQVLFDFLQHSKYQYEIFIPEGSEFMAIVQQMNRHRVYGFSRERLKWLYARLFCKLLTGKYSGVYINEGGHSRYINLMARLLPSKKFATHLRMIYDTGTQRLGARPFENVKLFAISNYVADAVSAGWRPLVVYDPFLFDFSPRPLPQLVKPGKIVAGIIGRIAYTKGFHLAHKYILQLEKEGRKDLEFHFYGRPVNDESLLKKIEELKNCRSVSVEFPGYRNKAEIYSSIDTVMHFCLEEGLGRIYLEAIEQEKPFIGFRSGGLTEIAKAFNLEHQLCHFDKDNYINDLERQVRKIGNEYNDLVSEIRQKKLQFHQLFSITHYCELVEQNIN